jgi:hypothetical protein
MIRKRDSRAQVSYWFVNARKRLWKPYVGDQEPGPSVDSQCNSALKSNPDVDHESLASSDKAQRSGAEQPDRASHASSVARDTAAQESSRPGTLHALFAVVLQWHLRRLYTE